MNAPAEGETQQQHTRGSGNVNLDQLQRQAGREGPFFAQQGFQDLVEGGQATAGALLQRIDTVVLRYVIKTWVPETLKKLRAESRRLHAENKALGLPAAHGLSKPGFTQTGQVLKCLQTEAVKAVTSALTRQLPEVLSAFSKEVLQTLKMSTGRLHKSTGSASTGALAQTGLTGAQTGPIVKTVELENVNSYLNEVQAELTELCKGANEAGDAQLVAHLVSALETADGGEFKFLRFPQLVDLLAQETLRLLGPYERKFAAFPRVDRADLSCWQPEHYDHPRPQYKPYEGPRQDRRRVSAITMRYSQE
jgi:hypothetical protein